MNINLSKLHLYGSDVLSAAVIYALKHDHFEVMVAITDKLLSDAHEREYKRRLEKTVYFGKAIEHHNSPF